MPIDIQRNIIFVHVPRTGGTSIEILLNLRNAVNYYAFAPWPELSPNNKSPQHFTYTELQQNLDVEFFRSAYKFAFVRNPWDRFVSEFAWRQFHYAKWAKPGHILFQGPYLESLRNFVRVLEMPTEERIDTFRGFDSHLETQTSFVTNEHGQVSVNFLGRFETYEESLRELFAQLRIVPVFIPRANRISRTHYRAYYCDYTRSAVEAFYAEDIGNFGYRF